MPYRRPIRFVWRNLAVVALLLSVVANSYLYATTRDLAGDARKQSSETAGLVRETRRLALENRGLALENRRRQNEIQQSRVFSCRSTYESFNDVFRPFFPSPAKRTSEQRANLNKLASTVRGLKRKCRVQTSTKEPKR